MEFKHKSVLLDETIEALNIKPDGIYLDGTLGGADILMRYAADWVMEADSSVSIRMRQR